MLKGIKQTAVVKPGGIIEVQSTDLPVGSTVEVIVLVNHVPSNQQDPHPLSGLSQEEHIAKIRAAIGGWKDDAEITAIFSDIAEERRTYSGRAIASFDEE